MLALSVGNSAFIRIPKICRFIGSLLCGKIWVKPMVIYVVLFGKARCSRFSPFFSTYLLNKTYIYLTICEVGPTPRVWFFHGLCEKRFFGSRSHLGSNKSFLILGWVSWVTCIPEIFPLTKNKLFNWIHLSHEKKPYYFPLYCLFNRDPYGGVL